MHVANLETLEIHASFADVLRHLGSASHVHSLSLVQVFNRDERESVPFRLIDERFCSMSNLTISRWIVPIRFEDVTSGLSGGSW